jgi:hypothetical protein
MSEDERRLIVAFALQRLKAGGIELDLNLGRVRG